MKKSEQQLLYPPVSVPLPYEWLPAAVRRYEVRYAATSKPRATVTSTRARCELLTLGMQRASLKNMRVFRLLPGERGEWLPAMSLAVEFADLKEQIAAATEVLRKIHIQRAREAMVKLAKAGLVEGVGGLRGWRWESTEGAGVVMQFATPKTLPEEALIDACDCVTDDMTESDVYRAVLAQELIEYAPKGWDKRRLYSYDWPRFPNREVK